MEKLRLSRDAHIDLVNSFHDNLERLERELASESDFFKKMEIGFQLYREGIAWEQFSDLLQFYPRDLCESFTNEAWYCLHKIYFLYKENLISEYLQETLSLCARLKENPGSKYSFVDEQVLKIATGAAPDVHFLEEIDIALRNFKFD